MSATLDLSTAFEQSQFSDDTLNALRELGFANSQSFDRFSALRAQLVDKAGRASSPVDQLRLGICEFYLGNTAEAVAALEKASPGKHRDYFLGQAYHAQLRYEHALAAFQKAAQAGWNAVECAAQQVSTLVAMNKLTEAHAALEREPLKGDASPWGWYARGRVEQGRGNAEQAMECYEKALELDEDHADAMFQLAFLSDLHGDEGRAEDLYEACSNLAVANVNALINLAVIYEDSGRNEDAVACLRRVLAVQPNNSRAQLYLKDAIASTRMCFDESQARVQEQHSAVLDIPITDFELSVRARNCLKKMNINTLGDLLRISERELLAYKNFGETSLHEIKVMLAQKGLSLGMHAGQKPAPRVEAPVIPAGNPEVLSRPVTTLELSVRSRKCLQRLGVSTIGELAGTSEAQLLAAKNFGQTSLNEIKNRLAELGLSLRAGA